MKAKITDENHPWYGATVEIRVDPGPRPFDRYFAIRNGEEMEVGPEQWEKTE